MFWFDLARSFLAFASSITDLLTYPTDDVGDDEFEDGGGLVGASFNVSLWALRKSSSMYPFGEACEFAARKRGLSKLLGVAATWLGLFFLPSFSVISSTVVWVLDIGSL